MAEKGYKIQRDIHLQKREISLYVDDFIFKKITTKINKQQTTNA